MFVGLHGKQIRPLTLSNRSGVHLDEDGHGYLFVVMKRRARLDDLERWRDRRVPVRVRYRGVPDAGACATQITPERARHL